MERALDYRTTQVFSSFGSFMRKCVIRILSVGALPKHVAFILDGNRRYAKKQNLTAEGAGHRAGFSALMSMVKYCTEFGIKYVTLYAFSIDNFNRRPSEVRVIMDLMLEKIEQLLEEGHLENQYGLRMIYIGNLKLLSEPLQVAVQKAMAATAHNTQTILLICVAYSSRDEIIHAVEESCKDKLNDRSLTMRNGRAYSADNNGVLRHEEMPGERPIKLVDVEQQMYMAVAPEPDILVRTSGEKRLSNFLTWQTQNCLLYSPAALWPEISFWHLVWAILKFQHIHPYLEKKKKQV